MCERADRKIHRTAAEGARLLAAAVLLAAAGCAVAVRAPAPAPVAPPPSLEARLADTLRVVLEDGLAAGAYPAAYAIVGRAAGVLAERGVGRLDPEDPRLPDAHTLWDIASLTKVLGLTSALMLLNQRGDLPLDAPVAPLLPEWEAAGREQVTVRHLLSHTGGLPPFRRLWLEAEHAPDARRLLLSTAVDTAPGVRTTYSDIGAWLLGELVTTVTGEPLDDWLARELFAPLGMHETLYRPPPTLAHRIAPTEVDPWRGRHIRGEVHDENAAFLGGVAGHAGLFSTAHDLARFARTYLNGGALDGVRVFERRTILAFTAVHDPSRSSRALGWDTADGRNSAGRCLSPRAFGHTGFTGTSLWIDPERDLFVLLLTNRVNPTRDNPRIGGVRVALADAVCAVLATAAEPAMSAPFTSHSSGP